MIDVDLKNLLATLNPECTRALEAGAGQCVSLTHHEVTIQHILVALLDNEENDLAYVCAQLNVERPELRAQFLQEIETYRNGSTGRPVFAPTLVELIQDAVVIGRVEFGYGAVRSGTLFLAMLTKVNRFADDVFRAAFGKASLIDVKQSLPLWTKESPEAVSATTSSGGGGGAAPAGAPGQALAQFTINFTEEARAGNIDPAFGRDREIRQMVDILARRRKNNPIAVGEPGVGKTAVIEGLAMRVAEGDVPDILKDVEIHSLDMGLLQAGASVKGEFEKRLKAVIDEVKASPKPIILFIDEAHTLIGAGNQAGGGDAANLLKPALARGELRTIAATTWAEYKQYFEKDAALARRFQLVKLDEPDVPTATTMLRGLKSRFEGAHDVIIRDDAITAAADLGRRYIHGRQHPDKGVDLVDTAAARVKITQTTKPGKLEDVERVIQGLTREQEALQREQEHEVVEERAKRLDEIAEELKSARADETTITEQWQKELAAANKVKEARLALESATDDNRDELAKAAVTALEDLKASRGEEPIVHVDVTDEVVAQVIADWTGIPLGNMVSDEAKGLLELEDQLAKRVKGQDHSMKAIAEAIRAAKAGLKPAESPQGVFLLVGPSGTGKTETALGVADRLFGGEQFMTTINMSEFMEKHNVSKLIGSPPGYVGYGEGGVLTEAVRQRPYSVVLLDECEKAHPEVMNLFYQVFDKGELNDGEGRRIDFSNTVLFMTSNLATDIITDMTRDGKKPPVEEIVEAIRPALNAHFKPALVARMTVVPYYAIDNDTMQMITRLKLGKMVKRLKASQNIELIFEDAVVQAIADRCTEVDTGARNIDHIIRGHLVPQMSREILDLLAEDGQATKMTVGVGEDGHFTYAFSND